mgnify:CR=1 FL=1
MPFLPSLALPKLLHQALRPDRLQAVVKPLATLPALGLPKSIGMELPQQLHHLPLLVEKPHRTFALFAQTQAMVKLPMNQPSQFGRGLVLSIREMTQLILLMPLVSFTVSIKINIPKQVKWMELLTKLSGAMIGLIMVL